MVAVGKLDETLPAPREKMADAGLKFIRRSHERGYHYFVANLTAKPIEGWFPLSVKFASTALLDPLTGRSGLAATRKASSEIYLQLQPGESIIVRTFTAPVAGAPWTYVQPADVPFEFSGTWHVEFIDGGPKLPASFDTEKLQSWTNRDDEDAKRFAGTARYMLEFSVPDKLPEDYLLDLGDVRESARVSINGQSIGTLWSLPFQTRVGSFIKPGMNKLEIEVTSVAANRIRDLDARKVEWKKFHEINFVNIHYQPFDASKWPLVDSGLLGPVKLIPMKKIQP
jgi:hypothetical protein